MAVNLTLPGQKWKTWKFCKGYSSACTYICTMSCKGRNICEIFPRERMVGGGWSTCKLITCESWSNIKPHSIIDNTSQCNFVKCHTLKIYSTMPEEATFLNYVITFRPWKSRHVTNFSNVETFNELRWYEIGIEVRFEYYSVSLNLQNTI